MLASQVREGRASLYATEPSDAPGKDAYMDGDNTAGLDELCARIDESSVLIFVQTEHALSCSWCLIQLAHAIEKKVRSKNSGVAWSC